MDLQPYSHYCFSKISRTLFDFLNNTYWVSLYLRNNLLIFWTGVSCFSVALFYFTLFCCGGKANLVRRTLFYSILLTLTHRQKDRQRVTYTRFAWAGGTFFQLCCCVSFLFWREIGFGCTYYYVLRVPYSCGVVLVFWFWQEALTHRQNHRWRNEYTRFAWAGGTFFPFQLCCCVSFLFWWEIGCGCTYYYVLRVPYSCGVVLVFLVLAGNSFWCYVRT